jgi:hypothetical protein
MILVLGTVDGINSAGTITGDVGKYSGIDIYVRGGTTAGIVTTNVFGTSVGTNYGGIITAVVDGNT